MGAVKSTLSDLPYNEYLKRFVGVEVISVNDPFWNQLLSFSMKLPDTSADYRLLEESVEPLFKCLLANSKSTGNLGALVRVFLVRAAELNASAELNNNIFVWQTFNALFLLRCIVKMLLENFSEDDTISIIQASPSPLLNKSDTKQMEDLSDLVENLVTSLIEVIVDVPLLPLTYDLHIEATTTLIVLLSSHIYSLGVTSRQIIFRNLLIGKASIHSYLLVKSLLKRTMSQDEYLKKGDGSFILGLASGLWNVLTLGISGAEGEEPTSEEELPKLAMESLLLLLILINHFTAEKTFHNPYRAALLNAQNFQDPVDIVPSQTVATFKIEFASLYSTIHQHLHSDQMTLLLYALLHKNRDFKTYVLSRTDVETLILPILKTLYNAPDSTSHHIYMSLIVLLILSEDDTFNRSVHDIKLKEISWYTERPINQISLGGLLILVVIRTITVNMSKMRDKYLHTNCLAALANMSSHFHNLHPYVCQRLVNLFETLSKRHARLCETLSFPDLPASQDGYDISDAINDASVLEEVIRMVLEIINSALTHQLARNHNLIYTLLYKRHLFEIYSTHPSFQDVTQNIERILTFLMERLEKRTGDPTVGDVQEIIKEGVLHLPSEKLKKFPELRFKYVEENEPEDFFIPYVWTLVYRNSTINWNINKIALFDPKQSDH